MKEIHATWDSSGAILLWGFAPNTAAQVSSTESENEQFFVTGEALLEFLTEQEFGIDESSTALLALPSTNGKPFSSPFFETIDRSSNLSVFEVPVVRLDPLTATALFSCGLPTLPGVRFGDSYRVFIELTKLLLEQLCRGRFLPGLSRLGERFRSRWDLQWESLILEHFENGVPFAAFTSINSSANPDRSLGIRTFLQHSADALIRSFIRRTPFTIPENLRNAKAEASAQWVRSLSADEGGFSSPGVEGLKLENRLEQWSGARKRAGAPVVVALVLREPEHSTSQWRLEFALQDEYRPNHQVSAASVWRGDLGILRHHGIALSEAEERLLSELGRALPLFPLLERALKRTRPTGMSLTTEEAYVFLREGIPLLSEAGFRASTPEWWTGAGRKLGLKLTVRNAAGSAVGLSTLLDYSWKLALGERELTEEEFQQLLKSSGQLIQLGGEWIEISSDKLDRTLRFMREAEKKNLTLGEALRLGAGAEEDGEILPVVGLEASGWVEKLLQHRPFEAGTTMEPESFMGELRPYQREGLSWLSFLSDTGLGGCLADDMGLGKTIQLLAMLTAEKNASLHDGVLHEGKEHRPTLLIVPMSILGNWVRESEKFAPTLKIHMHHGPQRLAGDQFLKMASEFDVIVTTYSIAQRDEVLLQLVPWGRIALDEAQNIKNLNTKQTRAIRRLTFTRLANGGVQRLALTGTPLENHLEELWSIFDFLNPGFLGDIADFRRRFAAPIERSRDADAAARLSKLIRPFVLRRLKSDPKVIADLPEKIEIDEIISLTPEQAALYQRTLNEMLPQVDTASGIHRKGLVLATITRLKQVCDHPWLLGNEDLPRSASGKWLRVEEILETVLAEDDRVLIFSQFAQMGHLLKRLLEERFGEETLFLHGALPRNQREQAVARFQKPGGPKIFILSLKAGGFGLNLTAANQVIHFDQWWNPAVQDQATDRAYRIGQKRSVQVRKLICRGTLEERIHEMLGRKRELAQEIVGNTKNLLTEMSTDELREILTLSSDTLDYERPEIEEAAL